MNYGGGQSGFMATRDEEKYVMEFPSRLFGIAPTTEPGEYGFGDVACDRTSFGHHRGARQRIRWNPVGSLGHYGRGFIWRPWARRVWKKVGQIIMSNAQYRPLR